jgi:metacaspase-1
VLQELPASFPRVRGCKKRALLVGISYAATKHELRGAVNSGGSRIDLRGGYKT